MATFSPKSSAPSTPLLVLIDGHALAYRSLFALREPMTAPDGEPTGATYGFVNTLLAILGTHRPTHLAVAFDRGRSGRDTVYPPYKANRAAAPAELKVQLDRIREIVAAFNIPIHDLEGYEADDVLGSLTAKASAAGLDSLIVTGDSDLLQLVDERTRVAIPGRRPGETEIYDAARVRERYGIEPQQLPEWKGLKGDTSDNVPGISGIGEKGATELIARFGSVAAAVAGAEELKAGRLRDNLVAQAERGILSAGLCRIMRDLPVELDLDALALTGYEREGVVEIFRRLGFRSLIDRLPALDGSAGAHSPAPVAAREAQPPSGDYRLVETMAQLRELAAGWAKAPRLAFDTETTGVDPMSADPVGIAIADRVGSGWYIAVGHGLAPTLPSGGGAGDLVEGPGAEAEEEGDGGGQLAMDLSGGPDVADAEAGGEPPVDLTAFNLPMDEVRAVLGPILAGGAVKLAHHAKYDLNVLARHGLPVSAPIHDTMVAAWLADPGRRQIGLKDLSFTELGVEMTPITELIGKGKAQVTMAQVDPRQAASYAAADVDMTLRLADWVAPRMTAHGADGLFQDLEMPLVWVLAAMERDGVLVDAEVLAPIARDLTERAAQLEAQVFELVGHPFNLGSPKQLSEVLFGEMGLPSTRRTASGMSTSADALADLAPSYPVIQLLLDHRHVKKLLGTYVEALPRLINPFTGRIHTSWQQTGTVTGRISSADPNLQNIPVRSELGGQIRRAFVAQRGWRLVAGDYSQMELRILASLSGDPNLLAVYAEGGDVHADTAAFLFQKPREEVTSNERRLAKIVNFGIVYGMGAHGLSRSTGWSRGEAAGFIERYFERYAAVKGYFEGVMAACKERGYVETILGRRRWFPQLKEGAAVDQNTRARLEREAINAPIQGSAADITKRAMLDLDTALKHGGRRARIVLQVHDELVLEVPDDEVAPVARLVRDAMCQAASLDGVDLEVDVSTGMSWGEMSPLKVG